MIDDSSPRSQAVVAGLCAAIEAASHDSSDPDWKREIELTDVRRLGAADLPDDEIRKALHDLEGLGYVYRSEARADLWHPTDKADGGLLAP
jgi:hypothetical protein